MRAGNQSLPVPYKHPQCLVTPCPWSLKKVYTANVVGRWKALIGALFDGRKCWLSGSWHCIVLGEVVGTASPQVHQRRFPTWMLHLFASSRTSTLSTVIMHRIAWYMDGKCAMSWSTLKAFVLLAAWFLPMHVFTFASPHFHTVFLDMHSLCTRLKHCRSHVTVLATRRDFD